jgi:ribosomal protein L22
MSPKRELDETKAANPDAKVAEEAAEAKAEQPKPRRRRRTAEPEAAAEQQDKPGRRRRRRKADDEEGAEPQAEATEAAQDEAAEPEPEPEADETPAPAPAPARRERTPADGPVVVRAHARYVRTSARKARLVCDHIRGKTVPEARAILGFTPRAAARDWSKVLESAIANAEANHELIGDELKVREAYADEGPTLKRYRPRAMGRATRIRKRTAHLTITLAPAANESKERSR